MRLLPRPSPKDVYLMLVYQGVSALSVMSMYGFDERQLLFAANAGRRVLKREIPGVKRPRFSRRHLEDQARAHAEAIEYNRMLHLAEQDRLEAARRYRLKRRAAKELADFLAPEGRVCAGEGGRDRWHTWTPERQFAELGARRG